MRARLGNMELGATFTFLCLPIMTDQMKTAIQQNGGKLCSLDERSYGVVMTIQKQRKSQLLPEFFAEEAHRKDQKTCK